MGEDPLALVSYYARVGYFNHVLSICSKYLHTQIHDRLLHLWHITTKRCSKEDIQSELKQIREQPELRVTALIAEIKLLSNDKQGLQTLHSLLEQQEEYASEDSLLLAATFSCHSQSLQIAKRLTLRVLKSKPRCIQAACLYGWILLATHSPVSIEDLIKAASEKFDEVLRVDRANLDALLGKAKCFELSGDYASAICELDEAIVAYPWFYPAMCEKGRMAMLAQEWDLMYESSQEVLDKDPENINGLRLVIQYLLCKENNIVASVNKLGDLIQAIEKKEPGNAPLYLEFAEPFARLAGRRAPSVLNRTLSLIEKSHKVSPDNGIYLLEMANEFFLLGDYAASLSSFRLALKTDEARVQALYGVIQCQLVMDDVDDAEKHLNSLEGESNPTPLFFYLKAQLFWLKNDYDKSRDYLDQFISLHLNSLPNIRDYRFFTELSPDVILGAVHLYSVVREYGKHSMSRAVKALELLLSAVPAYVEGHLMLAYILMDLGDMEYSQESLDSVPSLDSSSATAYMLLAEVELEQGEKGSAKHYLEKASNEDPNIRECLQYYILQAKILLHYGQLEQTLYVLEAALCLPNIKPDFRRKLEYYTTGGKVFMDSNNAQRIYLYFLLAEVQIEVKNLTEAATTIEDAKVLFNETQEVILMEIASAKLLVAKGNVEEGLKILQDIPCDCKYFMEAKACTAEIYLNFFKDKTRFCSCYSELAELFPSTKTYLMMGDALTRVREPTRAIKPYEAALKNNPKNTFIVRKIGKALTISHQYGKAMEMYESSLASNVRPSRHPYLQYDLAELCFNIRDYIKAEQIAKDAIARIENIHSGPSELVLKFLLLYLKSQGFQHKYTPASEAIVKLKGLLRQTVSTNREVYLPEFCFRFSQVCEQQSDLDTAIVLLNETLKSCPAHIPALICLSKIHLVRGEISECEVNCAALLKNDPTSLEGGKLLIMVLLQRELYDAALTSMQQFLQREPTCYTVLVQIIELLWKLGRIGESIFYIEQAEKASSHSFMNAGLYYCKGIQYKYLNDLCKAIELLNNARTDTEWGKPALFAMIGIYFHIDEELFFDEENTNFTSNMEDISTAQALLREAGERDGMVVAWECFGEMLPRQKSDAESALNKLNEVFIKEKEDIFIMLCIAAALIILKQPAKAKAQLRSIDRLTYKWTEGNNFERAWLMLAQIYMQSGKLDVAEQMCKKCLSHNKACSKAYEFLGMIMERGHAYIEAASLYEYSWKYHSGNPVNIGYKLARVYLKLKRYMDAISTCHNVLRIFPNNIKIRRDILDKARKALRH